jgi:glycosyltransferase involved in cell wall biosynthesis
MRTFYLVDPNLRDLTGHYFEYARSLADPVKRSGFEFVALGHKGADEVIANAFPFKPVFSRTIWDTFPTIGALPGVGPEADQLISNVSFYASLRLALPGHSVGTDSVVLAHMIRPHQLMGWSWWYRSLSAAYRPRLILLFRYIPEWFVGSALARDAFRALEQAGHEGRVLLATDSARLAEDYERLLGQRMRVLPIPHTNHHDLIVAADGPGGERQTHFVSLGNARDEKGILEILYAIRALKQRGALDDLRFTLQVNDLYAPNTREEIVSTIDELKRLESAQLRFIDAPLSSDDYYELLGSADVVMLPYWQSIYRSRTSGILAEALGAGKIVIVTDDTWMGDQVTKYGAGVLCRDRDVSNLADAITRIHLDRASFIARAVGAQGAWLATHNPAKFVASVLKPTALEVA